MSIQERINILMDRDEFIDEFKSAETPEDIVFLFQKNDIEVPIEIAQEVFLSLSLEDEELTAETLEKVAGGGGAGAILGGAIGNGIFYGAGYLGGRLAGWSKSKSAEYATKCGKFGSSFGTAIGYLAIPV